MAASSTYTTDFREELEFEQQRWLRKRFLWYMGVLFVLGALNVIGAVLGQLLAGDEHQIPASLRWITYLLNIVAMAIYAAAYRIVYRRAQSRQNIVRLVYWVIVFSGLLSILSTPIVVEMQGREEFARHMLQSGQRRNARLGPAVQIQIEEEEPSSAAVDVKVAGSGVVTPSATPAAASVVEPTPAQVRQVITRMAIGAGLGSILVNHLLACLLLPLTPRECVRPLVPLLVVNGLLMLVYGGLNVLPIAATVLSPAVGLPGVLICWLRQSRFRSRFTTKLVKKRYGEMKQELTSARQIHESLFPRPIGDGPVRFHYRYEPMRQIGGDYLYARHENGSLTLVIIDVTGHGIGAALTVNRLHGEISREFGEDPDVGPGDLLNGINAYLHHTLASHSVYATALCIRIEPETDTLRYASAGHPPAFIRTVDGRLEQLDSTTLVLGACRGDDFVPAEVAARFGPGDVLIAYTDGAQEARNSQGRMFGINGLRNAVLAAAPADSAHGAWCEAVLRLVDQHRFGPLQDDTLIVEVLRPV